MPSHLSDALAAELGVAEEVARGRVQAAATAVEVARRSPRVSLPSSPSLSAVPPHRSATAPPSPVPSSPSDGGGSSPIHPEPSPARLRAIMLWARLRHHIRQKLFERRFVTRGGEQGARKRRRRLSTVRIGNQARILASIPGRPHKLFNDMMSSGDAARERGAVLRQLVVDDVRTVGDGCKGHIIVCGPLVSFHGLLAPLRSPHMRNTSLYRHIVLLTTFDESLAAQPAIEVRRRAGEGRRGRRLFRCTRGPAHPSPPHCAGYCLLRRRHRCNWCVRVRRHRLRDLQRRYLHCHPRSVPPPLAGSVAVSNDLLRAGISTASCALLLSSTSAALVAGGEAAGGALAPGSLGASVESELVSEALDGSVIFSYLTLEQALTSVPTHPSFYIVVELKRALNMQVSGPAIPAAGFRW